VRWGVQTDTDDAEGRAVKTSDMRPDRAAIEAVLGDFTGEIEQVPPAFSAIKIDGNRAYDLARSGEEVVLRARLAQIDRWIWSACRIPTRRSSRPIAAGLPTCARWPGTWAARSVALATSLPCDVRGLPGSPRLMPSPCRRFRKAAACRTRRGGAAVAAN
jgi:hypothetical protein